MNERELVRRLIAEELQPGTPRSAEGLSVVPLTGGAPAPRYLLADEAVASGALALAELGHGDVAHLVVDNHGDVPVLILDGEHLEGAMQDRVVVASALVPPRAKTVLSVACVERGRWGYESSRRFSVSSDFAYARLRGKAAEARNARLHAGGRGANQSEIWADVAAKTDEAGVAPSATGAMGDAYAGTRARNEGIVETLGGVARDQTGAIASVGGRPVAMDVFDRPETLARVWSRLLRGYVMEALGSLRAPAGDIGVGRFLTDAAAARPTVVEGVGLGSDVALVSPTVVGNALVWEGSVVHLAVFRNDRREQPSRRSTRGSLRFT